VPVQPPPAQPANSAPVSGVAVSVTISPIANAAEHCAPQLMPPGFDVTAPVDVPSRTIVRFTVPGGPVDHIGVTVAVGGSASMMPVKVGSSTEQAATTSVNNSANRATRANDDDMARPSDEARRPTAHPLRAADHSSHRLTNARRRHRPRCHGQIGSQPVSRKKIALVDRF
jgi:hypothetical protein